MMGDSPNRKDDDNPNCHRKDCPADPGCDSSELVVHPSRCCPLCPFRLIVTGVRIAHDHDFTIDENSTNRVRFRLHVAVDGQNSSHGVGGEQLWRLSAWMSTNKDGSGRRMSFQPNIFNEKHAAKPYHKRNPRNFKWLGLEYTIMPGDEPCGNYFCVEFDRGEDPKPLYNLTFTLQPLNGSRERLIGCLEFSNCNDSTPHLHPELTSKRTFERNHGDDIIFECNATNAHIIWWEHFSWEKTERVSSNGTLRVDHVTLEDQGSYYCLAFGHGKLVISAPQVLIIPDIAQFILRIEEETSLHTPDDMVNYQKHVVSQLEKANFAVKPINNSTTYVSKEVNFGQELSAIKEEIWNILQQGRNSSTLIDTSNYNLRLEPLSLCDDDSVVTETGTLSFPSVKVNSETFSNELCTVPEFHRGTRRCDGDMISPAVWKDVEVHNCFMTSCKDDTRELVNSFFEIIEKRGVAANNVSFVSRELVDITTVTTIGIDETTKLASVLDQISSTHSTSSIVASNMLQTVDRIINAVETASNEAGMLPATTASRLFQSVDLQLENIQKSGQNLSFSLPNIEVEVVQMFHLSEPISFTVCPYGNKRDHSNVKNSSRQTGVDDISVCRNGTTMHIPTFVMNHTHDNMAKEYTQTLFPVTFTSYRSGVLFKDEKAAKSNKSLNSIVVSASTSYTIENLPGGSFIRITFSPLSVNNLSQSCVFWNYTLYGEFGGWSSEGCHRQDGNNSHAHICECNHMSHFALLMHHDWTADTKTTFITENIIKKNTFIVVGCLIAIISLLITTCAYLGIRDLRNTMTHQITINLCIAFLGLYCCFLLGTVRTDHSPGCAILAGFVHYFCLTSVAWMNVETTVLHFFKADFVTAHSGYIVVTAMAIAWGLPFLLVVLSVVAATESYAHENYCLPSFSSMVLNIFLLGTASVLFTYNLVIYFLINLNTLQSNDGKTAQRPPLNSVVLLVFWGSSLLFGFLSVENLAWVYDTLFCAFSSLVGFCIFLQYCFYQEAVISTWRRLFSTRQVAGSYSLELH